MKKLFLIIVLLSKIGLAQLPLLPTTWVDNNEATCAETSSCSPGSPGIGYTPAAYKYVLGTGWSSSIPSGCTFSGSYASSCSGIQSFVTDMEACRTYGMNHSAQYGIKFDIAIASYNCGTAIIIPQTNLTGIHATTPLVIESVGTPTLATLPEPVCSGGIQDNIIESTQIGFRNPDCNGTNTAGLLTECPTQSAGSGGLAYQLGITTFCVPAGAFTLANGTPTNTASYNYVQYMPQLNATGTNAPIIFCSVAVGAGPGNQLCNNGSTTPSFGPDLWLIQDLAVAEAATNHNNMDIINISDDGGNATSTSQWASHIHLRRLWLHGDWTSLSAGYTQTATALSFGSCLYCSFVGSEVSEMLRPGGEGHISGASGQQLKFSDLWLEGQSICIFVGGASGAPDIAPIGTFIAGTDIEHRRTRCTFPYAWLGSPFGPGNVNNADVYWGGAGDNPASPTKVNIDTTGLNVTYVSGPHFHDSTSSWTNNNVFLTNASAVALSCPAANPTNKTPSNCKTNTIGSGTFPGSPPTTLTLQNPACVATDAGTPPAHNWVCPGSIPLVTAGGFILNGSGIVRKNGDEKKSFQRYLMSGNITENVDLSGGQRGIVMAFSNRNCSGGCVGTNYQNVGLDLNAQDLIYRNACWDVTMSVRSTPNAGDGGGTTSPDQRLSFWNILHYNISAAFSGAVTNFCPTGGTTGFQINAPFQTWTVTVSEAVGGTSALVQGVSSVDAGANLESETITFNTSTGQTVTFNTSPTNTYQVGEWASFPCIGCTGDSGNVILQNNAWQITATTSSTVTVNIGQSWSGSVAGGSLIQGPAGFQYFGIPTGFPVSLSGCSGSGAFNTSSTSIGPLATTGSAAWTGVWNGNPLGPTYLQFPWHALAGTTETCTLTNVQGGPQNFYLQKNTVITDAAQPLGQGNAKSGGYPQSLSGAIQDNIFLNSGAALNSAGWDNAGFNEGNATEVFQFDSTSLSASNNVFPRPSGASSLYTYYGNNPNVLNTCLTPSGCTWPSLFFPTSMCAVGFVAPACSGFVPLTFPDYHSYALAPTLTGGGTNPLVTASTTFGPVGTIVPNLDIAQTNNTYFCQVLGVPVTCTNGPFPDNLGALPPPVQSPTAPAAQIFARLRGK